MQINLISKSLSVEVSKFLRRFNVVSNLLDGSKQAYSKAKNKIKWEGYIHLNDEFVKEHYSDDELKKYKDKYVLIGTDGTTYELPYEASLIEHFEVHDNGLGQAICMAQGLKLYDLLNDINLVALFESYNTLAKGKSERACFEGGLKRFSALINTSEYSVEPIKEIHDFLFVGDKYYSSFYNFYNLSKLGYYYVLRCKNSFCKEVITFCNSDAEEAWLTIDLTLKNRKYGSSITRINNKAERPKSVTVRCIKRTLDNGELLCLITNAEDLSTKEVCDIFYTRRNEETSFDTDKNKLVLC